MFCLRACLCTMWVQVPTKVRMGVRSPRTGAPVSCELQVNTGPLEEPALPLGFSLHPVLPFS